jgi:hypothetical protein
MDFRSQIPEPLLFNPLKHYLPFIRQFVTNHTIKINDPGLNDLIRDLRHLGNCVMDIYNGELKLDSIYSEVGNFLKINHLQEMNAYKMWTGTRFNDCRIISLSDSSRWTLKFHMNNTRYAHIFPARSSPHSFRIKANTIKSAILYVVLIGKDYVSEEDLNTARALAGLSPVKEVADAEAVTEMIEILRS